MAAAVSVAKDRIADIDRQLQNKQLIKKHCTAYRASRQIMENEKNADDPKSYRSLHQKEYELHTVSRQALKDLGIKALPSPQKLDAQISQLKAEQNSAREEWKNLRKQQDTLDIVMQNFNQLLNSDMPVHTVTEKSLDSSIDKEEKTSR